MLVTVTHNEDKGRDELLFNEQLSKEETTFLKEEIGLNQHFQNPNQWLAPNHPAYRKYAHDLKKVLAKEGAIKEVDLSPSFPVSEASIDQNKFSYVSIAYHEGEAVKQAPYVVFDSYKKVAGFIAEQFAKQKYGSAYKEVAVYSRNYKRKARALLKEGKVIDPTQNSSLNKVHPKQSLVPKEVAELAEQSNRSKQNEKPLLKEQLTKKPSKQADIDKEESLTPAITADLLVRDKLLPNVLVPSGSKEPFLSGKTFIKDAKAIQEASPNLLLLNDDNLNQATAIELFELSQLSHPTDYGFHVNRSAVLRQWSKRGESLLGILGFPTELAYPYVNIHTGYKSVYPLSKILGNKQDEWWSVVEHYRPIADLQKAITYIANEIRLLQTQRNALINSKTNKPKGENKAAYEDLNYHLESLQASKALIEAFGKKTPQEPKDSQHLDLIIAHMHDAYLSGKRMTKGQIIKLADTLNIPNLGVLWEAVELSWMLWYRNLYLEPIPFEQRLDKMVRFWQNVQPTYAYSDSSKEIYKQYSTPCPIGAILAQYTRVDSAKSIFEPSAGNGLLLVGAAPSLTHANEIDPTRLASLAFQQFKTISSLNAAQPFPKELDKSFEVMVTNPPFAPWHDTKLDKKHMVNRYFNKHIGLEHHMRLEHVMCGLALKTLKDHGKAALIIMGHLYFDPNGLIGKYRPFFNWLFRHYHVDDVINLNSFKLYNKQGAVEKTMLILINGRKAKPNGVAPKQEAAHHFYDTVDSFQQLWERVKPLVMQHDIVHTTKQLQIALEQ